MTYTVLGIYQDRDNAEDAINELDEAGYSPKNLSIIMKDNTAAHEMADSTGAHVTSSAVSGASTGAVVGGLAGVLIGIGAIAIPGVGGLLIGGPIATAFGLTGAAATTLSGAATGAITGGILGTLMGLGLPHEEAKVYEDRIHEGAILLAVALEQEDEKHEVREILHRTGADQLRVVAPEYYETPRQPLTRPAYAYAGVKGGRRRRLRLEDTEVDQPIRKPVHQRDKRLHDNLENDELDY